MKDATRDRLRTFFIWLLLAFAAMMLLFILPKTWLEQRRMSSWPEAEATILSHGYEEGRKLGKYRPVIRYEYEVEGRRYENDGIYAGLAGASYPTRNMLEGFLARFPVGDTFSATYDPDDPQVAYLLPDSQRTLITPALAALWFLFLAWWIRRMQLRARKTPPPLPPD